MSQRKSAHREGPSQGAGLADIQKAVTDVGLAMPHIRQTVDEIVEDNVALTRAIRGVSAGQEALRIDVCRELDRLRSDVAGALLAQSLKQWCRELSAPVNALEGMLAEADLTDAATVRQHLESIAITLAAVLARMGIERQAIAVGQDRFDLRIHECVRRCPAMESPFPDAPGGVVVRVVEPGYIVNGNVALVAKVWVQEPEFAVEGATVCDTTK